MAKNKKRNRLHRLPQRDEDLAWALYEAFLLARRGKTKTNDEFSFEANWYENLKQLEEDILTRRYKPSRSKAFITHTPVTREIFAVPFRDRIVHHLLYAIVAPWWDKRFIATSFSCRDNKGTDYGAEQLQKAMRRASQNGQKKAYVLKGDLSGYFMSLKRDILYKKVIWGLKKQFPNGGWLYDLCEFLWKQVIYDDPTVGVRIAGKSSNWVDLPLNKSLFHQPNGQGIVIGNLTSQLLSNIMLNEFDWWMKRTIGFKHYGRYVDDFYIVVAEEDFGYALVIMQEIAPKFLADMGLRLHPNKRYIQEVRKGCPFLGKKVHMWYLLPGDRFRKNAKQVIRSFANTGVNYEGVASYIGMAKHATAHKYLAKEFEKVGWEYRY